VTRESACLLYAGAVALVSGVALIWIPAAVILAGVLLIACGVLSLEAKPKTERP
jgi:hypothetical protein